MVDVAAFVGCFWVDVVIFFAVLPRMTRWLVSATRQKTALYTRGQTHVTAGPGGGIDDSICWLYVHNWVNSLVNFTSDPIDA